MKMFACIKYEEIMITARLLLPAVPMENYIGICSKNATLFWKIDGYTFSRIICETSGDDSLRTLHKWFLEPYLNTSFCSSKSSVQGLRLECCIFAANSDIFFWNISSFRKNIVFYGLYRNIYLAVIMISSIFPIYPRTLVLFSLIQNQIGHASAE